MNDMEREKKLHILVVEDDAEMRETLSDVLSEEGYEVKTAGTGKEALAREEEEKFPICLIDLKLPDISGIEVLKVLKTLDPEIYAIIITAFASKDTAIEALKAGAWCYLEKPVNVEELLTAIEHASAEHRLREDKRRAEEELRKSEEKYRSLVESTEDSIYLVDRNCKYLFVNEQHLSRLGITRDEYPGRAYHDFHSTEEAKRFADKIRYVLDTGTSTRHEYRDKNGRYFLKTLSPIKDPNTGEVTAVTVVSKDITDLKRAEEELMATRDYLNNIIDSSADTITVVDMDGIIRNWNRGAEGVLGYHAEEVIGTPNRRFFADPAEADRIMELVRKEGVIKNYRTVVVRKDGEPVHISMSASLLRDKNGVPIGTVRVSRNITKEVELEKRLKAERDNLNLIFESMPDGVYIISEDYKVEFMNRVLREEFGDQIGGICYKVFHERGEPCPRCKLPEVMKGQTVRWEWYSRRTNRTYDLIETPLRGTDGTISKLTIFRDITDRKRMEEKLKESRKFLETVIDNIPDTITLRDRQHRLVLVNQAYCNITGLTKHEIIGKKSEYRETIEEVFQTGRMIESPELSYTDAEGVRRYVHSKKIPLTDESGKITHVLTISHDITGRKRAEEERERLIKELEAKNAEMERFIYTVSHDLRSPLVTIQGFVGMLRKDLERGEIEKVENDLKYIENSATKMDRLLNDTLELSRIGHVANPSEDVPFDELVQEALEETSAKLKSSEVEVSVADAFPTVHVDRLRIVEVLVNLIENSINYMGDNPHPKIEIGYRMDGEDTVFYVRDNGIGIDRSQHDKVFELFYKVDNSSKGTGAGLAIVKRIIEVHNGRVWIESEPGKGCTVCFTLPVV